MRNKIAQCRTLSLSKGSAGLLIKKNKRVVPSHQKKRSHSICDKYYQKHVWIKILGLQIQDSGCCATP